MRQTSTVRGVRFEETKRNKGSISIGGSVTALQFVARLKHKASQNKLRVDQRIKSSPSAAGVALDGALDGERQASRVSPLTSSASESIIQRVQDKSAPVRILGGRVRRNVVHTLYNGREA